MQGQYQTPDRETSKGQMRLIQLNKCRHIRLKNKKEVIIKLDY